mmetsp:Transcript_50821/g.168345  ORF Transcript_50821/g.168345 Transcript_50821/m.168345 type:complete len:99 (-) Transcript_50821:167-463(-)
MDAYSRTGPHTDASMTVDGSKKPSEEISGSKRPSSTNNEKLLPVFRLSGCTHGAPPTLDDEAPASAVSPPAPVQPAAPPPADSRRSAALAAAYELTAT